MTAPIPPVTPAHAEGITATEQAVGAAARCLWEEVFIAAGDEILWSDVDEPMVRNGMLADAELLVEAIAPIIAAATGKRIALAIEEFADACSARAERYAGELPKCANEHNQTVVEVFRRAAAIARNEPELLPESSGAERTTP